jgi:hypothetical protein
MRVQFVVFGICLLASVPSADAQCFGCGRTRDPNAMDVRTQLNIMVPLADKASPGDASKAVDDTRRQLSSLMDRELEAVKSVFGNDATLKASSVNSNMQDNDFRGRSAFVSMSNTYEIKRTN